MINFIIDVIGFCCIWAAVHSFRDKNNKIALFLYKWFIASLLIIVGAFLIRN